MDKEKTYVTIFVLLIILVFVGFFPVVLYQLQEQEITGKIITQNQQWHSDGYTYTNFTVSFQNYPNQFVVFKCDYYHINSTLWFIVPIHSWTNRTPFLESYQEGC